MRDTHANLRPTLRAAIAQSSPVMFNKEATLKKVVSQIEEAGRNGAALIVFPESLVPCYPYGLTFGFTVGSRSEAERADWQRYYEQSVVVSRDLAPVAAAAKLLASTSAWALPSGMKRRILSIAATSSLSDGTLAAHHRKIKPTGAERYIWADSHQPSTYFPIVQTPWGPWDPSSAGKITCHWPEPLSIKKVSAFT